MKHSAMFRRFSFLAFIVIATLAISACRSKEAEFRRYDLDGKILAVDGTRKQLTIAHKDIPGLMKAMTMEFKVNDDWVMRAAKPGDHISAQLVMDPDGAYLDKVTLTSAGTAPEPSTSKVRESQPGDHPPDVSFVNQDGKKLKLSDLQGRPVLLTFIYTRCPLPDFCIRMSDNFGQVARELKQSDPNLKLQMVSFSIDPDFDKPPVLKNYGKSFAGSVDPKFSQWQFVSTTPEQTRSFADYFGLSYNKEQEQIVHSLRTVLLDSAGNIVVVYNGNDWTAADVIRDLKALK